MTERATLYSFRRCPYAMRARLALAASGQQCVLREIVLRDKPAEMIAASAKATVPVLCLTDGRVLDESLDIMMWALQQNDPGKWLSPESGSLDEMTALIQENDGPFKQHLDRYKYENRYDDSAEPAHHRSEGSKFLASLNARLERHGQLFGTRASLADVAIFPFVRQFANTDRDWFDAQPLQPLQDWLAGHLNGELFQGIMLKWPVWSPGDAETLFPAIH